MQLKSLGKFMKTWYPAVVMAIIIFIFSSFPAADSDQQSGLIVNIVTTLFPDLKGADHLVKIIRKIAHLTEYAILGYLTARGFRLSNKSPWFSVLACAIYAATDEFHQTLVQGRSGEIKDVALDTLGATLGASIYWLTHRR